MRVIDLITKTRDGKRLSAGEIEYLIQGYVHGKIPDYQMAAWTMAVYLKGLSEEETIALTKTMLHSGDTMDLTWIQGVKLDKHSTGGVGDTTTLILGSYCSRLRYSRNENVGKRFGAYRRYY